MALSFGLIGCGEIGRIRAAALERTDSLQLVCVSDQDSNRASEVAARHQAAVERKWLDLVRRPDIDAVVVSTPPSLHATMCLGALEAGKHVLCEKPLGRTAEECRLMVQTAERSGRLLATGFNYRFYPSISKARALLDSGLIGALDHVRAFAGYSATDHNHSWLHEADEMGGGALRDNGIHLIDLTRYFLGEVAEVQGMMSGEVWNFPGCEDNGFLLLRSRQGKLASLQASWTEWRGYRFQLEIYGSRGCIRTSCFPMLTEAIWAEERGAPTRRKRYWYPWTHVMEHLRSYRWVLVRSFVDELRAFEKAVAGESTVLATGKDGLRSVEIAEHIAIETPRERCEVAKC